MQIILAILALSFLILIHEFGHFTAAKLLDVKVREFSIFMGPKLFSFQRGETTYSIRAVPIGGYVRMEGEEEASDDERAFNKKPLRVRAIIIAAGSFMNLLVAIIFLSIVFSIAGFRTNDVVEVLPQSSAYEAGIQVGDKIVSYNKNKIYHPMDIELFMYIAKEEPVEIEILRDGERISTMVTPRKIPAQERYLLGFNPVENEGKNSNIVEYVSPDMPAGKAGLMKGDRIVKLNDVWVNSRQDINDYVTANKQKTIDVRIIRGGSEVVLTITPAFEQIPEYYDIGINMGGKRGGIFEVIGSAFEYTFSIVRSVYYSIIWLITGVVSLKQVMGPIGIVTTIGVVVQQPSISLMLLSLLNITAFISINLGVFNLIPFPALDGSKLILIAVEGIRKKALPPEKEAFISFIGFILLIMLMLITAYNDIVRTVAGG